jgi:hypothetical protein
MPYLSVLLTYDGQEHLFLAPTTAGTIWVGYSGIDTRAFNWITVQVRFSTGVNRFLSDILEFVASFTFLATALKSHQKERKLRNLCRKVIFPK